MPARKQTVYLVAAPASRPRKKKRSLGSSPVRRLYQNLTTDWKALSGVQKAGFAALGKRMTGVSKTGETRPLTAYQCFLSLGTARAAQKMQSLEDAPIAPDAVPFLAHVRVAAVGPAHREPKPGTFQLTVHADPIDTPIQVFIARPSPLRDTLPRTQDYRSVGVISGIGAGGADITGLCLSKYYGIEQGFVIAVRLVPLTVNGFRGQAVCAMGTVAALGSDKK